MTEEADRVVEIYSSRDKKLQIMQEFLLRTDTARPGDDLAAVARQVGIQIGKCLEADTDIEPAVED